LLSQLLLINEDRAIQGKFHALGAKVAFAESDADVVERSRNLFRGCMLLCFSVLALVSIWFRANFFLILSIAGAVPFLLQGGGAGHWAFSCTLVSCYKLT